jgi:Tol biopolymer transport system component
MAEKGGTKTLAIVTILIILISIGFSGCINNKDDNNTNKNDQDKPVSEGNIWMMDIDEKNEILILSDGNYHSYPTFIDNDTILFTTEINGKSSIWTMDINGNNKIKLIDNALSPSISPDKKSICFIRNNSIFKYDNIANVTKRLYSINNSGDYISNPTFNYFKTKIIYVYNHRVGDAEGYQKIYIMDLNGKNNSILVDNLSTFTTPDPTYIPYSNKILFMDNYIIYSFDINTTKMNKLTDNKKNSYPRINSNGDKIIFKSMNDDGNNIDIWIMDFNGNNQKQLTSDERYNYSYPNFSPDGMKIIYIR